MTNQEDFFSIKDVTIFLSSYLNVSQMTYSGNTYMLPQIRFGYINNTIIYLRLLVQHLLHTNQPLVLQVNKISDIT